MKSFPTSACSVSFAEVAEVLGSPSTSVEKNAQDFVAVTLERSTLSAPSEHPSQLSLSEVGCGFDSLEKCDVLP